MMTLTMMMMMIMIVVINMRTMMTMMIMVKMSVFSHRTTSYQLGKIFDYDYVGDDGHGDDDDDDVGRQNIFSPHHLPLAWHDLQQ